ncbi:MAG: type III pantothenate kinase, partial [Elusimicrobiota bacterium]
MSHQNLLAIDIGNSTITFAILQGNKTIKKGSFNTDKSQGYPYYYQTLLKSIGRKSLVIIKNVAISSVVPELDSIFILLCKKLFGVKPFFVNHKNCSLKIRYSNPSQVGADRLANSVAGKELLGCPLIIIDFGTAITFDCVN